MMCITEDLPDSLWVRAARPNKFTSEDKAAARSLLLLALPEPDRWVRASSRAQDAVHLRTCPVVPVHLHADQDGRGERAVLDNT